MHDTGLPLRTLRTGFWVAALAALLALTRGRPDVALGLCVGAAIGLFSLWSLMVIVPRVFAPGSVAPRLTYGTIAVVKLPLYALVLNWAVNAPYVSAFAVFAGAAVVPVVLVLKVVGQQLAPDANSRAGDEACRRHPSPSR